MWQKLRSFLPRIVLSFLLVYACCYSSVGYTMMPAETMEYIKIPTAQWQILTSESKALKEDLIQCRQDLTKIKKPSAELLKELDEAEKRLKLLQEELTKQKEDLILLSNEVNELKTLSEKLKKQIDKERRVHKRQIWQNRMWCLLIGAGIGFVAGR